MLIFLAITFLGFVLLVGGSLLGHDHDADHDHDHDHGHEADQGNEPTVSIFSFKVIGAFIMGFGAAGAIADYYGSGWLASSLAGLATGILLGFFMYGILRVIYSQQSDSLVPTDQAIGKSGLVTIGIDRNSVGQVSVVVGGQDRSYLAREISGQAIPKGRLVIVRQTNGGELLVEEAVQNAQHDKVR
jgi:membrane protein implicated in regulation of membrane protease activity